MNTLGLVSCTIGWRALKMEDITKRNYACFKKLPINFMAFVFNFCRCSLENLPGRHVSGKHHIRSRSK